MAPNHPVNVKEAQTRRVCAKEAHNHLANADVQIHPVHAKEAHNSPPHVKRRTRPEVRTRQGTKALLLPLPVPTNTHVQHPHPRIVHQASPYGQEQEGRRTMGNRRERTLGVQMELLQRMGADLLWERTMRGGRRYMMKGPMGYVEQSAYACSTHHKTTRPLHHPPKRHTN